MKAKKILVSCLILIGSQSVGFGQTGEDSTFRNNRISGLMSSLNGRLKGAQVFNTVVNCLELVGTPFFITGLAKENGISTLIGFELGFAGMEMSKYSPIPLTKAKRDLNELRPFWKDTASFNLIYNQVSSAGMFSYASMSMAFIAQGMFMVGIFSQNRSAFNAWIISSFVCTGISFGLAVGSTIMTTKARTSLGRHGGTVGLNIGNNGIGAVYEFPSH